jgi:ATP-dependent DNA helicase RecG
MIGSQSHKTEDLFNWLLGIQNEVEWLEFKMDNSNPHRIGEYVSSLSNSAAYFGRPSGYLIWGIEDTTMERKGTLFKPNKEKVGNESFENWLLRKTTPRIQVKFYSYSEDGKDFVILEVPAARNIPSSFDDNEYIRIGSHNQKLKDYPDWERKLWNILLQKSFEKEIALEDSVSMN